MNQELHTLRDELVEAVNAVETSQALEALRVEALGKKGRITAQMKTLGGLAPEERKAAGQALNEIKQAVASAIEVRKGDLADAELNARLASEALDVSLPVRPRDVGQVHPISQTLEELVAIFGEMGFAVAEGPHIEDDFHNFEALNIPALAPCTAGS